MVAAIPAVAARPACPATEAGEAGEVLAAVAAEEGTDSLDRVAAASLFCPYGFQDSGFCIRSLRGDSIERITGGRPLEMGMNTKKGTFTVLLLIAALLIAYPIDGDARGGGGGHGGSHSSGSRGSGHAGGGHISGGHSGSGHRGGGRVVIVRRGGGGVGWGWWAPLGVVGGAALLVPYGTPYYPPPEVALEQSLEEAQPNQQELAYWYYCPNPEGYYPYVKSCPIGWMRVIADANPPDPEGETGP
jgi:hypothetical protein